MQKNLHFWLAATALALTSCSSMKPSASAPGRPEVKNLSPRQFAATIRTDYLLFLPEGYSARSTKKWPCLVFLHGSGERGSNLWRATIHGPVNYIKQHPDFPFIMVTPLCAAGHKWSDDTVLGILDEVTEKYAVDTNRVYLTGLSMGGFGTWSLATTFPERFAAVAPVCGGEGSIGIILSLMDQEKKPALKTLPIWAFHGGKDPVVPWEESDRMVKAFQKIGNPNVKLTTYPEAAHNSWTVTYNNPDLYAWFLQHERKNPD